MLLTLVVYHRLNLLSVASVVSNLCRSLHSDKNSDTNQPVSGTFHLSDRAELDFSSTLLHEHYPVYYQVLSGDLRKGPENDDDRLTFLSVCNVSRSNEGSLGLFENPNGLGFNGTISSFSLGA